MADPNPFLSLFSTQEEVKSAKDIKERQASQVNNVITRIFLMKGG